MNRIYQGRVTRVEIPDGKDENGKRKWKLLDKWRDVLWEHHKLFQDAVNYYTLALAAMAKEVNGDSPQAKALRGWVEKVRETWSNASRKDNRFDGPQSQLAPILKLAPAESGFDAASVCVLRSSRATPAQRASVLFQLLEEVDKGDLNKVCGERIAFLCPANPTQKKRPTSKAVSSIQEQKMQREIRRFHLMGQTEALKEAANLNLGLFLTQPPTEFYEGTDAVKELRKQFKNALAKFDELKAVSAAFEKDIDSRATTLRIQKPGRKPKGIYPIAVIFKCYPCMESYKAFLQKTKTLAESKDKQAVNDVIAEARVDDQPHFDYFTNMAFVAGCEGDRDTRAVWFEYDLAAFIEAIKAPHRYYQDTIKREVAVDRLSRQIAAMKSKGREASGADDESEPLPGFEGDSRIDLLEKIVQKNLAWLADAEENEESSGPKEYTIRERTVRGFGEMKKRWRDAAEAGKATEGHLLEILAGEQAAHRDDFGSADLYRELAKPEFHPIWRDAGTQLWHADDPLAAWLGYKELEAEMRDKKRAIRFTPAHSKFSPRYFILPKQGRFGSDHEPGRLSFTAGVVLQEGRGLTPTNVRIHYAAPRLCRDFIRSIGDSNLDEAPWLQPMMVALGLDKSPEHVNFANCRITLQPSDESNIQLTFPVEVSTEKIEQMFGCRTKWDYRISGKNRQMNFAQFNYSASEPRAEMSLRWPSDIQFSKEAGMPRKSEPVPWHEKMNGFRCLATDLGQRNAGAFARLFATNNTEPDKKPSRFIGEINGRKWHAVLERSGLFRLPGEDAKVWRAQSRKDVGNEVDSGKPFDFREELWGERGRPARDWEAEETAELMRLLEVPPEDKDLSMLPDNWRIALSFPEQNDKLLIAMRRYQSRIARLHRWNWFLQGDDSKRQSALGEIAECEDIRIVSYEQRTLALKHDPRLLKEFETQLRGRLELAPILLVRIANRILPMRGRSWQWVRHPAATIENPLHQLTQNGPSLDSQERPVWLRGQRGLSMKRIEQFEELRKRCQSLNQTMRREIGGKPRTRRDESVPDPCPDLLEKLDSMKKQRVNQTAHMILAEALGLRLASPLPDKKKQLTEKDLHGVYEKILDTRGQWIGPVDFIVIEDLSRYRASQGRAPRENGRLMKWCHRAVRNKLKQLCEIFGLPVLETPAAYSSRFCSRSGVPGFRAEEVTAGFTNAGLWAWLTGKKDEQGKATAEAQRLLDLDRQLSEAQIELERQWTNNKRFGACPKRTLIVPISGGPIFVPVVDRIQNAELQPAVVQADINAAINLGLRAIADPRLWPIHPRLRTERVGTLVSHLITCEKRKLGKIGKRLIVRRPTDAKTDDTKQPNFFADLAGLRSVAENLARKNPHEFTWLTKEWTSAEIVDENNTYPLLHGKSLWGCVKAAQWDRVNSINAALLSDWHRKTDIR